MPEAGFSYISKIGKHPTAKFTNIHNVMLDEGFHCKSPIQAGRRLMFFEVLYVRIILNLLYVCHSDDGTDLLPSRSARETM